MNLFNKTPLGQMLNRVKTINEGKIFIEIMSLSSVQKFVVKLNTDQMRLNFMNSEGVPLSDIGGEYSFFTMSLGNKKGRSKVDLYGVGEFHESFRIERVTVEAFEINSDPVKEDGTNLLVEWGKEIEGLTFANLEKTGTFIKSFYVEKIKKKIEGR